MDAQLAKTLTLGKRILIPGCSYSVIQPFIDDKGLPHDLGQTWTYLGVESPKMYAGYVLYIFDTSEKKIRLKYLSNGQPKLIEHLEQYLSGPTISTTELLSVIPESARTALSRIENWLDPIPSEAEGFIFKVREAQGNASCAVGRSGSGSPYEQVVADLAAVYREAINAFKVKASDSHAA